MRNIQQILTVLICVITQSAFGQIKKSEITYIWKDSIKGFSQSIFFETDKDSNFYDNITSFKFGLFDKESYESSLDYLKDNKIELSKKRNILPSTKWITLKQYQGKFYAYCPCDFYTYYKVSVNDTTYVDWTGEGPIANKINNQKKVDDTTFEINVTGVFEQNRNITINIIDNEKGIAVFVETKKDNSIEYYLMIMSEKIKSVPLIVNYCESEKQMELEFEKPNFVELLKKK